MSKRPRDDDADERADSEEDPPQPWVKEPDRYVDGLTVLKLRFIATNDDVSQCRGS